LSSLADFISAIPKVELHLHFEGSLSPRAVLELARRRGVDLPARDEAGIANWMSFRDFAHFVEVYLTISRCLRDPEDFQLAARELLETQARQNIVYSEVHLTIGTLIANGVNGQEVAHALAETLEEGEKELGVRIRWLPDIVRDVSVRRADTTLEWALEHRERGVVGLGLSGFESSPTEPFEEHFRTAEQEGLGRPVHAGEQEGPKVIRDALEICHAQRIGHGIRAVDDPELLAELAERRIPLEVCPTSNIALGMVGGIAEHPLPRLLEAGIHVTLNSDDPPMFGTTLTDEYVRVSEAFDLEAEQVAALARNGFEAAFVDPGQREAWVRDFEAQCVALSEAHLGRPVVPREATLD
jgi:aminodeoxyfutalosine deaminase